MTNMSCYHSKNIYFSDARHYSQIDISVISISGFNFGSSQFIELLYLSMLQYDVIHTLKGVVFFKSEMLSSLVNFKYL